MSETPHNEDEQHEMEPIQWAVLQDIPQQFYSEDTQKPLEHCLMCERYLLDEGTAYLLEKAMRRHP